MDSYIVRIYRRNLGDIAGIVETVETGTRTAFADGPELLAMLGCPPPTHAQTPPHEPPQGSTQEREQ